MTDKTLREILFRGKRKDNSEWVEGYYAKQSNHACFAHELKYQHFIFKDVFLDFNLGGLQEFEVIPSTVGQYTGLTDKNGKKIFEGDIISVPFEEDRYPYEENVIHYENAEVYFDTERYSWYVRYSDDDSSSLWEYDDCDIIVIGNVHDNSELINGQSNDQ